MEEDRWRNLEVWKKADDLALQVFQATKSFPKEEIYGLTSQIRRSALSIPTNIVKGYSRRSDKELARLVSISLGSLVETMRLSDASSEYNSLQIYLGKRRGNLNFTANYTYGTSYDNASGNGDDPEDYRNVDYNWGPSNFDRPHIFVGTWTYRIPFMRNDKSLPGRLASGSEVSGIYRYQSGQPLTVTANTAIGGRRADYIDGVDPYVPENQRSTLVPGSIMWLNPAAFAPAPADRRGNSLRGQFRSGPTSRGRAPPAHRVTCRRPG